MMDEDDCLDLESSIIFSVFLIVLKLLSVALTVYYFRKPLPLTIYVVETPQKSLLVTKLLEHDTKEFRVLGIDGEWVTEGKTRKPVALLQLCSVNGNCGLFRLAKLGHIPEDLQRILENENIIKVGILPEGDAKFIYADYGVHTKSTLDLRHLCSIPSGLAVLSKKILNMELDKNYRVRCSDWEADQLNPRQVHYAAMDALAAVEIFKQLTGISQNTFSKLFRKSTSWETIEADIVEHLDSKFKLKATRTLTIKKSQVKDKNMEKVTKKAKQRFTFATQKKIIYENCFMKAPNGTILCTTSKSKLLWYLKVGKAELESEDPFTVRLLFEPKYVPAENEHLYERSFKDNLCVVCGTTQDLLKHCVVPKSYTKLFPSSMKSHCSHDILLFCIDCHLKCEKGDQILVKGLEELVGYKKEKQNENWELPAKLRHWARALITHGDTLPEARTQEIKQSIKEICQVEEITDQLLKELADAKPPKGEQCSKLVVKYFSSNGRTLFELQKMWRQHFIDTMKPKFLPTHWSVNHTND